MNWQALFKSDYIKAVEMGDKTPTLTITDVIIEKIASLKAGDVDDTGEAKRRDKGVLYFREIDRGWVINRTNATCLAAMFGADTESWKGHRVTLFAQMVQVGRKRELGIRVKGSPDLKEAVEATIELPRKKPIKMTMLVTGKGNGNGNGQSAAHPATQQPEPPPDAPPAAELPASGDGREPGWDG